MDFFWWIEILANEVLFLLVALSLALNIKVRAYIFFLIFFRRGQGNLNILLYWPNSLCFFACCSFCCALPSFSASKCKSSCFLIPEVALVWVVWKCLCTSCRVLFILVKNERAGETQGLLAIKTCLLGMTVDHKLSWIPHTLELRKSFVNKLYLLKKLRLLPRKMLQDFYLRVINIFPSVNYGLILWCACCNSDNLDFLERLHCIAARIIFNLLKALASHGVLERAEWFTFRFYYKIAIFICMHKAYNEGCLAP